MNYDNDHYAGLQKPVSVGVAIALLWIGSYVVYNLCFHPLAHFPGPLLWRAFRFSQLRIMLNGQLPYQVKALHDRYGPVVRTAPDELSFIDSAAWRDIYWRKDQLLRPVQFRSKSGKGVDNFISADVPTHRHFRKIFGTAFTDSALRDHENSIQEYVTKFIERLQEATEHGDTGHGSKESVVDLNRWLNFVTFDIIGDLTWNASFECLDRVEYHPWVSVVLHFRAVLVRIAIRYYALVDSIIPFFTPKSAVAAIKMVNEVIETRVAARLASNVPKPDIISWAMKHNNASPAASLSVAEIETNCMTFVVAGSEQVTTALPGTMNCLLQNATALKTLTNEIRQAFINEGDITASVASTLPYLTAVLNERMRLCPPVPDNMRRFLSVKGGAMIAGWYVPEGTVVSMSQWGTFRSEENFASANAFKPEGWLPEAGKGFANDHHEAFQPFSIGQANCIGQPLAWLEMRVILARLLWNFDLEFPEGENGVKWSSQKIFWSWEKKQLRVALRKAR